MNTDEVKAALHIDSDLQFTLCSSTLFDRFLVEFQKNYVNLVPHLLKKYKVLVYNGQFDIRCSVLGTNEWVRLLEWDGKSTFNYMDHEQYKIGNTTRGLFKSHKNLLQSIIYGAGHLAPL
jgi:vitellogenic carboxypeptidase-like protein